MAGTEIERRLAAILSADAVGYSRLMAENEAATIRSVQESRALISEVVASYRGRVVDAPGDNVLAEFPAALAAVEAAIEIQNRLHERGSEVPESRRMQFRIGIHLGDVATDGTSLYGDGVNIAARLEGLAEPGGICISGEVHGQVRGRIDTDFEDLGDREVKNIPHPVRVYRLTSAGAKRAAEEGGGGSRGVWIAAAAVIAVLAVAWFFFWAGEMLLEPEIPIAMEPSIAVLPFVNLSADPDNEYFSDGLSEEILNSLAQLRGLKVAARTSSFAVKNRNIDLADVGEQLGVGTLLEGSVRKQGTRVRITAQLINVSDGYHMWSQSYDRELDDVFAVQAEIAKEVARMLRVTLLEADAERMAVPDTQNPMAYDKYLWGLQRASEFSVTSVLEAVDYFRAATELDPDYAKAHAGVTNALALAYTTSAIPAAALVREGARHAERAIELDPGLSEARSGYGAVLQARGQAREAEAAYHSALELNPGNSLAAFFYGNLLIGQHRFEEALALYDQVLERSPLDATLRGNKGWAHDYLGNPEEALASYSRARAIDASNPFGFFGPGLVTAATGELAASVEWFERAAEVDPNDAELFAWAAIIHLSLDDQASATRFAEKAVELNPLNTVSLGARSLAHVFAGEDDRAVEVARRGLLPDVVGRFGNTIVFLRILRNELLASHRIREAIDAYEVAFPTLESASPFRSFHAEFPQHPLGELARAAVDVAHLRQMARDVAGAERLIDLTRAAHERDPYLGYLWLYGPGALQVELALLEGRHEAALEALEALVEGGWSVSWRWEIERNPIYDPVRDHPRYRTIVERLERHVVAQRGATESASRLAR